MKRCRESSKWDSKFTKAAGRFIARAKASGWWEHMTAIYFFCAPDQDAALRNVRGDSMTLSVSGKITFVPLSGVQGDGDTGFLDTKLACTKIPGWSLNEQSLFVFLQTDNPSLAGEAGALGGNANVGVRARNGTVSSIWSNTRTFVAGRAASGRGLTGFVRSGADGGFVAKDDTQFDFLQKPVSLPTGTLRFLNSGGRHMSRNKLAFGFLGNGKITKAQALDIYQACLEMLGESGLGTLEDDEERLPTTPPHAFPRDSINQVTPKGLKVFRMSYPPAGDTVDFIQGFANGPLTDCVSRPWGPMKTSTDTQVRRWELIWSDRALGPSKGVHTAWALKPNDTMGGIVNSAGIACRTEFTSYEKAIGSTLVKTAYSAGLKFRNDPDHPDRKGWGDIAEEWGYNVDKWDTLWKRDPNDPVFFTDASIDTGDIVHRKFCAGRANVDAFFRHNAVDGNYKTSQDRVILGTGRLADIPMGHGFLIDHEHADSRTPEMQLRFLTEMRKIAKCKGYGLVASGHLPASGTGYHCGWRPENAHMLLGLLDWHVVTAGADYPGNSIKAHLEAQHDFFKGPDGKHPVPGEKLCLQINIGAHGQEISLSDMRMVREFMISKGIKQCLFVPTYAKMGGSLERMPNQIIATLLGLPARRP